MRVLYAAAVSALILLSTIRVVGAAPSLVPGNVAVGCNLQTWTTVALSEPAPADLNLTLTSGDPSRLLLSNLPSVAGSPSISLRVRAGFRESPDFWLHALGETGEVKYTVSASGFETATGSVTLTPSGIVIIGPFGEGAPFFLTTPRAWPSKIKLHTVRLDASLNHVEPQYVRGGLLLEVALTNSNPAVGTVTTSPVRIQAASDTEITQFAPAAVGNARLAVAAPPGFRTPARLNSVRATVRAPGLGMATDLTVGENLQINAALSLGEPAPEGGVTVTLTSGDPEKLLLSNSATEVGRASIDVKMAGGSVNTTYYLQALGGAGTVTHTASAPGYVSRVGTLALAPSGVIISLPAHGPPDEAELFRPESAGGHQNLFVALLSEGRSTPLVVYTAYLDPVTHRAADITVQPLRAGLTLPVDLKNTNPAIGTVDSRAVIKGGHERCLMAFTPIKVGQTVIAVATPEGFTQPSNATELMAIVRE